MVVLSSSLLFVLASVLLPLLPFGLTVTKVAVIGATGRLGREVVQQLASAGICSRCLVRQLPSATHDEGKNDTKKSSVATDLQRRFPEYIEFVRGDVSDIESLRSLVSGCDACLALFGPTVPKPFFKALFPFWYAESDPQHPYNVNFIGVNNLITVLQDTPMRLVRITGKGEDPWSIFSILINAFGGIAKGWNYEGEQLLRKSTVDYTIIRPGIMKEQLEGDNDQPSSSSLALLDNGRNLPVTAVSYTQIAQLVIQCMTLDNCKRATITAMNPVPKKNQDNGTKESTNRGDADEIQTLDQIRPDNRAFPESLIREHKQAARVGGLTILGISALLFGKIMTMLIQILGSTVLK
jgi:hypothetical protein